MPRWHYRYDSGASPLTTTGCISLTCVALCDATQRLYVGGEPGAGFALVCLDQDRGTA